MANTITLETGLKVKATYEDGQFMCHVTGRCPYPTVTGDRMAAITVPDSEIPADLINQLQSAMAAIADALGDRAGQLAFSAASRAASVAETEMA